MRKTQMAEHRRSERIVVRAEDGGGSVRLQGQARRADAATKPSTLVARTRRGATMDYQMGFTSGPSN
jgi:hypothetical protein